MYLVHTLYHVTGIMNKKNPMNIAYDSSTVNWTGCTYTHTAHIHAFGRKSTCGFRHGELRWRLFGDPSLNSYNERIGRYYYYLIDLRLSFVSGHTSHPIVYSMCACECVCACVWVWMYKWTHTVRDERWPLPWFVFIATVTAAREKKEGELIKLRFDFNNTNILTYTTPPPAPYYI